jgi:hypothetical protein
VQEGTKHKWFGAATIIAILVGAIALGAIAAAVSKCNDKERMAREEVTVQTPDVPKLPQMSNEANVFLRLLRTERVLKADLDAAFPVSNSMGFDLAIRNTVRDLKDLDYEDVRSLILDQRKDLGVVLTGDNKDRLLAKLRQVAQLEDSAGPELMILPIVQPMK